MDWYPLLNSLRIAAISTAVVYLLGIWLADVVARAPRVVKGILDVVLTLPLVLPPTVVGYLLLVLLGPRRPIGSWVLATFGVKLTMTWYSAIFATVVVSFPLMYRTARGAFEGFDQSLAVRSAEVRAIVTITRIMDSIIRLIRMFIQYARRLINSPVVNDFTTIIFAPNQLIRMMQV